uniref:Myeloid leukemia factor 2 n=2 Tax=Macaca TaxID=9539 RepID=A0A5F8ACL8_MACMU
MAPPRFTKRHQRCARHQAGSGRHGGLFGIQTVDWSRCPSGITSGTGPTSSSAPETIARGTRRSGRTISTWMRVRPQRLTTSGGGRRPDSGSSAPWSFGGLSPQGRGDEGRRGLPAWPSRDLRTPLPDSPAAMTGEGPGPSASLVQAERLRNHPLNNFFLSDSHPQFNIKLTGKPAPTSPWGSQGEPFPTFSFFNPLTMMTSPLHLLT